MRRIWGLLLVLILGLVSAASAAAEAAAEDARVAGKHQWTRQFGTGVWDWSNAVAANGPGVYVVGATEGALPGQTKQGEGDAFVRKYDHAGNLMWTRQFGTGELDESRAITVDGTGVYLTGETWGAFPGWTNQGSGDGFVRKYGPAGAYRWTRQFGTADRDRGYSVAVNTSGVYVTGETRAAFPGWANEGGTDVFLRKYSPAGEQRWTRQFGTSEEDSGRGVAVDTSGVYVVGITAEAFPGQTHQGALDVFVRKYDHAGKRLWTRQFGTSESDGGRGVAVNASGLHVAGYTGGTLPGQTNQGLDDVFVRAYDPTGKHLWTRQFGTTSFDAGCGIAVTGYALYVAGYTERALPGQTSQGQRDAFVRKYATG
jgi:hypothetical protein